MKSQELIGFESFGSGSPVVCFCDGSWETLDWLVQQQRYEPWGLMLDKEYVYEVGGGPAYYVRDDEWTARPAWAKPRSVRFQPRVADWTHEREWRVPLREEDPTLRIDYDAVVALLVGDEDWAPVRWGYDIGRDGDYEPGVFEPAWLALPTYGWDGKSFVKLD